MPSNSTKILLLTTLLGRVLVSVSSNSWLGAWIGLEINLISFIPLTFNAKNMYSTEASLKYFIEQVLASATLRSVTCFTLYCIYLYRHCCTLIPNISHGLVFFKRTPRWTNSKWRKRVCSRENFFHMTIRPSLSSNRHHIQLYRAMWLKCDGNRTQPSGFKVVREQTFASAPSHASLQTVNKLIWCVLDRASYW